MDGSHSRLRAEVQQRVKAARGELDTQAPVMKAFRGINRLRQGFTVLKQLLDEAFRVREVHF